MRKDVLISICGFPLPDEMPAVLTTPGRLYRKNGIYSITYRETELTGQAGVTTTLKVEPDRITLQRRGGDNICMVFRQGEKHYSLFDRDGEPVTVAVSANNMRQNISDAGGQVDIDYSVFINDAHTMRSLLHVDVHSLN